MAEKRIYLLDTSVLIYDPESLLNFEKELVGISIIVLEELDKFKVESTERGAGTRAVIRRLDGLRKRGSLRTGVHLENGSIVKVLFLPDEPCPMPLKTDIADNEILMTGLCLKKQGYEVYFVSKDLNARVKADVIGLKSLDYEKNGVSKEKIYKGWRHLEVPAMQLKKEFPDDLLELAREKTLTYNEFILVTSRNNPMNYKLFRYLGGKNFKRFQPPSLRWPLEARNPQQAMALDLLLDPAIPLVSLIGPAGTGKTFLALLAGLQQILVSDQYKKMLISRPVIPLGPDIGYLPGTIEEKLRSWMQPMYDNMEFISSYAANISQHEEEHYYQEQPFYSGKKGMNRKQFEKHLKHQKHHNKKHSRPLDSLDHLIREGKISLEAITYMRGRSIPFQYILLDEVQNLTPHEVKTLISRVGEGSKIVLAGDPYQIDTPYLDFSSNGLVVASSKFKGEHLFGMVFLECSERSELSNLVSRLL